MRLFRAVRSNPPTKADFTSPWDAGRRPPRPELEGKWRSVSTFVDFDKAVDKAAQFNLGDFIAALEVPDTVQKKVDPTGHVDLINATPGELLACVEQVSIREARVTT